jgi:hypothetical protein
MGIGPRGKLKAVLHVTMQRQQIDRETKSSGAAPECGTKLSERLNGLMDEIRRTMWSERDRVDEIERQKWAGEIERMKSQREFASDER